MTATPLQFLHGAEVIELATPNGLVAINDQAAVGLVGTAPDADLDLFPHNVPVLLNSAPQAAASLGAGGTLKQAVSDIYLQGGANVIVVNVPSDPDLDNQLNNIIGSSTLQTGCYALQTARALVGVQPKTVIAPGFTSQRVASASSPSVVGANPVVGAMLPIVQSLRGRIYASTLSDSYDDALLWASDWGDARVVCFYPNVLTWSTDDAAYMQNPADAAMAGLLAQVQQKYGFWWSPSNHEVNIGGVSAPVNYDGTYTCEANLLNQNKIATILNIGQQTGNGYGGWRRWGNRNLSTDPNWVFECVRTTADAIYDALDQFTLAWVDADPTPQVLQDMTYAANQFFLSLQNQGIIVGGKCWLDPELNTAQQMAAGIYCWSIDPTPAAPMEHIVYYAGLNDNYYTQELDALSALIVNSSSASANA